MRQIEGWVIQGGGGEVLSYFSPDGTPVWTLVGVDPYTSVMVFREKNPLVMRECVEMTTVHGWPLRRDLTWKRVGLVGEVAA